MRFPSSKQLLLHCKPINSFPKYCWSQLPVGSQIHFSTLPLLCFTGNHISHVPSLTDFQGGNSVKSEQEREYGIYHSVPPPFLVSLPVIVSSWSSGFRTLVTPLPPPVPSIWGVVSPPVPADLWTTSPSFLVS